MQGRKQCGISTSFSQLLFSQAQSFHFHHSSVPLDVIKLMDVKRYIVN